MNKIKQWLRRWLGVDEDPYKIIELRRRIRDNATHFNCRCEALENRTAKLEDVIGKTIRAGFDHHIRQSNWIVLAWRENNGREHIHFYEVKQDNLDSILYILKTLKRENVIIDTHPQIAPHFKW